MSSEQAHSIWGLALLPSSQTPRGGALSWPCPDRGRLGSLEVRATEAREQGVRHHLHELRNLRGQRAEQVRVQSIDGEKDGKVARIQRHFHWESGLGRTGGSFAERSDGDERWLPTRRTDQPAAHLVGPPVRNLPPPQPVLPQLALVPPQPCQQQKLCLPEAVTGSCCAVRSSQAAKQRASRLHGR